MKVSTEKVQAFQKHPITQQLITHYILLWLVVLSIHFLCWLAGYFFHLTNLVLNGIALLATLVIFLLFKDLVSEKIQLVGANFFKFGLVLSIINLSNGAMVDSLGDLVRQGRLSGGVLTLCMTLMDVILLIFGIVILTKPKCKEAFDSLLAKNFYQEVLGEEIKPGDAVIGIDVDTKKPVVHPLNDRYLHYLFLGPTGSGKTALSLTPMVWRDLNSGNVGVTVIEPKGDFAEKVYAMAKICGREVVYFNPINRDCPYFNPLYGPMNDVIENMATTFGMFSADSSQFFRDANDGLLRRAVKVIKRLYGNDATLVDLSTLLHNAGNAGKKMINEFQRLPTRNATEAQEQEDIALWFLNDYFTGISGDRSATKTYENTSAVRTQISKLNSNAYLKRVLNPPKGHGSDLDFAKALAEGGVLAISTAQGKLQDLGKFLGYFIILQFQSSVFSRPGNEDTRKGNMLYIDEFQVYANMGFANMLTQGRSYRVASHLATQNRALIGANAGKDAKAFIDLVSTNARNQVIYGGGNYEDAKFYSSQFGEKLERRIDRGISRPVMSPLYGLPKNSRPSESIKEVEETVACYSPSDIIYKEFGYVTYSLIKRNSIQAAGVSKLDFIPYDLKVQIDKIVSDHKERYEIKNEEELLAEQDTPEDETPISIGISPSDAIQEAVPVATATFDLDPHTEIDLTFDLEDTLAKTEEAPDSLSFMELKETFDQPAVGHVGTRSSITLDADVDDDV